MRALCNLERKGVIEKKRDALGNVVTRPGKDGIVPACPGGEDFIQ
jgi:hypothetical protein